ncbi:MAG TPA: M23 family metallopeptidase [Clostridiaceae bacterium]|nr:M23 family metallopeptidase [Clostridiaceae bacterium]
MDDVIVRSRYPRRNTRCRKRKSLRNYSQKSNNSLALTITRQLIVCLLILLLVVIIKGIQVPFTKGISEKIKYVVVHNIDFTNLYNKIDGIVAKITNKEKTNSEENKNLAEDKDNTYDADSATDYKGPVVAGEMYIPDEMSLEYVEINAQLIAPVEGTLSSPYGERMHPIKKTVEFHRGIDIEAAEGTKIRAALGGKVVETGEEPTYGKYVKIEHTDGITTVYAHCSKIIAEIGQKVNQGDIIAEVGDTGAATGSHLHFEIWKDGKSLNPSNYIDI